MKSIGFTYRIPRYIPERQNWIGFTYNLPLFIYSAQCSTGVVANMQLGKASGYTVIHDE